MNGYLVVVVALVAVAAGMVLAKFTMEKMERSFGLDNVRSLQDRYAGQPENLRIVVPAVQSVLEAVGVKDRVARDLQAETERYDLNMADGRAAVDTAVRAISALQAKIEAHKGDVAGAEGKIALAQSQKIGAVKSAAVWGVSA